MSEQFLGEIEYFAFNFAPKGWAQCSGQLLPINQNQALFSLLGTTYGGDGITTFALPDLRSRIAVGQGQGTNLSPYLLGQTGGTESVTLTVQQMPGHTHAVAAVANPPATPVATPAGNLLSVGTTASGGTITLYATGAPSGPMNQGTIGNNPGGQPHDNRMPYLALSPCIALQGIFPTRN